MRLTLLVLAGTLVAPPVLAAPELATTEEIKACIRRNNLPEVTTLQAVKFSSRDRLGDERSTNVRPRHSPGLGARSPWLSPSRRRHLRN